VNLKQVIIVDQGLNLPRGKLAAQVAHGSIAAFLSCTQTTQRQWLQHGMAKIVLSAEHEQLIELHQQAQDVQLPVYLVKDAGKTLLAPGTITCMGLGPATAEEIDKITGHLALLK